jgi:uncharacterized protein (TIGR02145 family)
MAKIVAYATDTDNPAPDIADYVAAGVTGVDAANLNAVNEGVAAANATGVDTVTKIQAIASAGDAKVSAMTKIVAYATDTDNPAPTVADYETAGVTGVDAANLNAVNVKVEATNADGVNTVAKIQAIVAMDKIRAYAVNNKKQAPDIKDYAAAGVTGVNAANLNAVNYGLGGEDVSTVAKIQTIVDNAVILPSGITINDSVEGAVLSVDDATPYSPAINIEGVVDSGTNVVSVRLQYTVTGSTKTLPAYSKTFTIDAANTQNNVAGIVARFSWEQQNLAVGSGTFNATITTDSTYYAKKLDIENNINGIVVATFRYPNGGLSSLGTATLRVLPVIRDRMFGIADNNEDTETHKFLYLPVKNPITGRTWLNNNLGAEYADTNSDSFSPTQQATASDDYKAYGSLFQWGRKADGHELINWTNGSKGAGKAGETPTNNDAPADTLFITQITDPYDWRAPYDWRVKRDDTLWENEASANNVCPVGYRLPTAGVDGINGEWKVEVDSWNGTTSDDALANTLKLPMSGRHNNNGGIAFGGSHGAYWSANVDDSTSPSNRARNLYFKAWSAVISNDSSPKAFGFSVRCIKD